MTAKNDCHLKSIVLDKRTTWSKDDTLYYNKDQVTIKTWKVKIIIMSWCMMTHNPHTVFSFCNYYYTYFTNYFAAPYQKLYRAHPISSYSMLLCMLYHLLLKYVNQILFVFSLFLAYYIIDNYYMSVGFKVKSVSREMSTVDLNNNNWVLYLIFLGLLLLSFCNTNSIKVQRGK